MLPVDKGRELERQIAEFFALNGYQPHQNVVLEGRSGGRHELDVLAERSDGITTYRVCVECKAWGTPIEKDVVAKLDYVVRDLGLSKGIIVALAGWRVGAEQSAGQLGIELWGPDEIRSRLGQVALAGLKSGPMGLRGQGLPFQVSDEEAHLQVARRSRSRIGGFGREEIVGVERMWIAFFILEIACSRLEKQTLRRPALKSRTIWNAYEGIEGVFLTSFGGPPATMDIAMQPALRPRVTAKSITSRLQQTMSKALQVVRPDAQQRYAEKLAGLGIPLPVTSISVEGIVEAYAPYYVGRLRAKGGERLVAIDGIAGHEDETLGAVLTGSMSYVIETVRQSQSSATALDSSLNAPVESNETATPPRPDL